MKSMPNIIEIEHANVQRDGKLILKDVSLSVEEGERIAILGPNGAGKSTLVDVIARKSYPLALDEYKNKIFGAERWIIKDLRPLIGHVSPSEESFFSTRYPVREIVASGISSSLGFDFHHVITEELWKRADEELLKVGMLDKKSNIMNTLSSGEKRRVLLARAAINKPPLLLLDEASSGLDFPSRADLRAVISSYAEKGRTMLMVTHELSEIIKEVDRVILMQDGKIVRDGRKEELLQSDILSDLYRRHVEVVEKEGVYTAFC